MGTFEIFDPAKQRKKDDAPERAKEKHEFEKNLATILLVPISDHFIKIKHILEV